MGRQVENREKRTSSLSSWFFICGTCLRVQESPAKKAAKILDTPAEKAQLVLSLGSACLSAAAQGSEPDFHLRKLLKIRVAEVLWGLCCDASQLRVCLRSVRFASFHSEGSWQEQKHREG